MEDLKRKVTLMLSQALGPADAAPVAAGWQPLTRDNGPDGFYLACLHKRGAADDNKVTDQRS